jgi:hypothetical protein
MITYFKLCRDYTPNPSSAFLLIAVIIGIIPVFKNGPVLPLRYDTLVRGFVARV